jgi:hypothetical protein
VPVRLALSGAGDCNATCRPQAEGPRRGERRVVGANCNFVAVELFGELLALATTPRRKAAR